MIPEKTPFSLPDDLDQDTLRAVAVELAVENLFPGAEVQLAPGDGADDLAAHDLPFQVGVGIVLAGAIVVIVVGIGIERSELLEPFAEIVMETAFVVIDEHR
jgi:hypothetical protein